MNTFQNKRWKNWFDAVLSRTNSPQFIRRVKASKTVKAFSRELRKMRVIGYYNFSPSIARPGELVISGDGLGCCYFKDTAFRIFKVTHMTSPHFSKIILGPSVRVGKVYTRKELANLIANAPHRLVAAAKHA